MEIDDTLEEPVHAYIETVRPIGAQVTVDSPDGKTIDIAANIVPDGTVLYDSIVSSFTEAVAAYLKDLVFETYSVSYARIGSLLLSVPGVADYNSMQLNGGTSNISIAEMEMPILGSITLTEVS